MTGRLFPILIVMAVPGTLEGQTGPPGRDSAPTGINLRRGDRGRRHGSLG